MTTRAETIFYHRLNRPLGDLSLARRRQDVLYDRKWRLFLYRAAPLRHLPFINFVYGAGSLALGNVNSSSDFDVIIGARAGRLFTVRFLAVSLYGLLGWRRRRLDHRAHASDKLCFNHFISPAAYALSPPRNLYWRELYHRLVPIIGAPTELNRFLVANTWAGSLAYYPDLRHCYELSPISRFLTRLLSGRLGDGLEFILKQLQLRRIRASIRRDAGEDPRLRYDDSELEFHPDTSRINRLLS